jgi:hypothetical protein
VLITFFTSGWSGATPKRTRPKGTGSFSKISIWLSGNAYELYKIQHMSKNIAQIIIIFFFKNLINL